MTLRSRLLIGLLAVTAAGLVVLSAASYVMLRTHLMNQLDGQLTTAASRAAQRIGAERPVSEALTGSPYALAVLNLANRKARLISGEIPGATELPGQLEALDRPAAGVFDLGDLRAAAARGRVGNRLVVVAVQTEGVNGALRELVVTSAATGLVLLAVLALGGRFLIIRGLAPLGRMAGTAAQAAAEGRLDVRMPEEASSEAGRLGAAINGLLRRIQQAFADRWASEERVRRFAADASHELRTPLTAIRGYAELYRTGAIPDAEMPQVMDRIEDEANRMSALVGDLLELARLDRGAPLAAEPFDLAGVARSVAADFTALGMAVTVEAPPSLPVVADEARLRQVLVNLLDNVREHTPEGTSATVRLAPGPPVRLEVADDGPGMPREKTAHVFDRFHGDGSGLGLSIVSAIAVAHSGRAALWSEPGRGTVVRIDLPVA